MVVLIEEKLITEVNISYIPEVGGRRTTEDGGLVGGIDWGEGVGVGFSVGEHLGTRQQRSLTSLTISQPAGNSGNLGHL